MMNKNVCVILAKGHSRRLNSKNKAIFGGQTLTENAVECAIKSGVFDRIILDTDDHEIGHPRDGVEIHWRSDDVRGDEVPSVDVILSIPDIEKSETITLLQPTSPLRTPEDIMNCMTLLKNDSLASSVVSVVKIKEANRIFRMINYLHPVAQDSGKCCVTNGAIWLIRTPVLLKEKRFITSLTLFYEMPKERSVDIDTKDDFLHALALWNQGYGKN